MYRFADECLLDIESGAGGPGHVSFRREKFVARGGPDGGDGGRGGDVVFVVKPNLKTLVHLRRSYKAENGEAGGKRNRHGRDGRSVEIPVPPGTIVRDAETGQVLRDFFRDEEPWRFLAGGKGGHGNAFFVSARHQGPRFAQPGLPGTRVSIRVELSIIADIGFVGFPNAGKSSLLAALSNARPAVADYPFTTKTPHLGVMRHGDVEVLLADIPGIIEGASRGAGLGLKFLKHIARTKGLAFLIDLSDEDFLSRFEVLVRELDSYTEGLSGKPRLVVATKLDVDCAASRFEELTRRLNGERLLAVSVHARSGLEDLRAAFVRLTTESQ